MIKEIEQYVKDKIELESKVLSLKDTLHNQNHTINNLRKELEDKHPRVRIIKKNLTYYVRKANPADWNMIRIRLVRIYDLLCSNEINTAEKDLRHICEYLYIQKEEQIEEESFINLEEVEKRIESKLEEKYKKEFQKLATSTSRIRVLEDNIGNCRSNSYRYEEQIGELQEELFECYDNLDELNGELNELRNHHNKLKNHWLVKLLRL